MLVAENFTKASGTEDINVLAQEFGLNNGVLKK